jgi:hypothetical protein
MTAKRFIGVCMCGIAAAALPPFSEKEIYD